MITNVKLPEGVIDFEIFVDKFCEIRIAIETKDRELEVIKTGVLTDLKAFQLEGFQDGIDLVILKKDKAAMRRTETENFKRIGTEYYCVKNGLNHYRKSDLIKLFGQNGLKEIECLAGFTNIPAGIYTYEQIFRPEALWNLSKEVKLESEPGEWPHIEKLLLHLFEEQLPLILDYLALLFQNPIQKLPMISLQSKEQACGKSTFLYLLKLLFQQNMAIITSGDLSHNNNYQWADKLILASEGPINENRVTYELIKSLITCKEIMRHESYRRASFIPCHIHFIECRNTVLPEVDRDSRVWNRLVKPIKNPIPGFDKKIEDELPAFIHSLQLWKIRTPQKGRLWFSEDDLEQYPYRRNPDCPQCGSSDVDTTNQNFHCLNCGHSFV